jgi:hypothetical protein
MGTDEETDGYEPHIRLSFHARFPPKECANRRKSESALHEEKLKLKFGH